jgi:hypothetical protein
VIDTFRWGLEQRREIDALEITCGGDQVVLGARGPNIGPVEEPRTRQRSIAAAAEKGDQPLETVRAAASAACPSLRS